MSSLSAFVRHVIATDPLQPPQRALYEYLFAGNGIFLRAERQGLSACIPLAAMTIHGLPAIEPVVTLSGPPIPLSIMETILSESLCAWGETTGPKEALFHCRYGSGWTLTIPEQHRTYASVRCTDSFAPSYADCLVEIHSHHEMSARFSGTDDADETGFRLFGVLGNFAEQPAILFRVGIYGNFYTVPAAAVAELPAGLADASQTPDGEDPGDSGDTSPGDDTLHQA